MWVASKPFRYRGVRYNSGDRVPAESWPSRRALVSMRKIRHELDPLPNPNDYPLAKMKREELNALALQLGISEPEELPNREAVIEAIKATAPESSEDEVVESDDESNGEEDEETDVEPPADSTGSTETPPEEDDEVLIAGEDESSNDDVIIAGDDLDFSDDTD